MSLPRPFLLVLPSATVCVCVWSSWRRGRGPPSGSPPPVARGSERAARGEKNQRGAAFGGVCVVLPRLHTAASGPPPPPPAVFLLAPSPPPGPARGLKKKGGGLAFGRFPSPARLGKKGARGGPPASRRPPWAARARARGGSFASFPAPGPPRLFPPVPPLASFPHGASLSLARVPVALRCLRRARGGGAPRPRARGSAFLGVLPLPSSSPTLLGRCDGIRGGLGLPGGACVVVSRGPGFFLFPPAPVLAAPVSSERAAVVCGRRGRMVKGRAARGFAGSPPGRRVGGDVPSPAAVRHGQAAPWA